MQRAFIFLLAVLFLALPHTSHADYATIELKPGFNLISLHAAADIGQWLTEIGFGNEVQKALAWDAQAEQLVVLTPFDNPPASIAMAGDEGIIVHATTAKQVSVRTVACSDFQFNPGFNLVALACRGQGFSAFALLDLLGSDNASSIQRYNPETSAFETAAFASDGALVGVDFAIASGEGYFLFMKQAVAALDGDADGILDADESSYGTAADDPDSDDDGLLDGLEVNIHGTSPLLQDTDEDTFSDAVEVAWGTSPLDISDTPPVHDPEEVVTPLDQTVAPTLFDASQFLYTGDAPIQTGMDPAVIDAERAAVLRGQVRDRAGQPLSGVTVTILNHPEYGQTLSRHDGWFDLVVNGGGPLTIRLVKEGYLSLQRGLQVPWQDYVIAPEMVMVQPDPVVTAVDLNDTAPIQVVRSSVVTDEDGSRQATLLIEQGTNAEMVMPDGSTQPLTNLSVRATEFTVGEDGSKAMPAELPPASAYTYCVDLNVDEAADAGATDVRFDKPVYHYVEDFIGFPVGSSVPVGYYDEQRGVWVASENGKVIKILGITAGLADLDTDGDDAIDDAATLLALNVTDAERQNLANLYSAGQQLWRVPIEHFTKWDCNWGWGPPEDAVPPSQSPPPGDDQSGGTCEDTGSSVIECQNQVLGEEIDLVGMPYSLNYRSNRTRGFANVFNIPLSGDTLPASTRGITLELAVAGKKTVRQFPAATNQTGSFIWDGIDAYGRRLNDTHNLNVRVGYVYGANYQYTGRFGYNGSGTITGVAAREEVTIWQDYNLAAGNWDATALKMGGWTIDAHHHYDPLADILYRGDGRKRYLSGSIAGNIIETVAGEGSGSTDDDCTDEGPALGCNLYPSGVAAADDGSFYINDGTRDKLYKIDPQGVITIIADNAGFAYTIGIDVDAEGNVYMAGYQQGVIYKFTPDGERSVVAGIGSAGFSGDGGPATAAQLSWPQGVAVGLDGSLYIADTQNHRIRRVGPDGIITTVAGSGSIPGGGYSGDGGPATAAQLNLPQNVAVGPDGSVYITDYNNYRIRRVGPDGIITTVAGNGTIGSQPADGIPAVDASLYLPNDVSVGADGNLYISEYLRIRRVGQDGIITTVAGTGTTVGMAGDGAPATAAKVQPIGIDASVLGSIYLIENNRVRRVAVVPLLSGYNPGDVLIASQDGSKVYLFNDELRHMRTLNALTGTLIHEFSYNSDNLLEAITDGDGNVTTIERDAVGNATAVVGPYGQRTTLSYDANGLLSGITNPATETYQFDYTEDGLMTEATDPNGHISMYAYDPNGRLISAEDAAGGLKTLEREDLEYGYEVTKATAMGRTSKYRVERLPSGEQRLVNTLPDGNQTETVTHTDGSQTTTYADGTIVEIHYGPDPRFGMLAPVATDITITAPSGLTSTIQKNRTSILSTPNDPLSHTMLTETLDINGQTHLFSYNAETSTMTLTTPEGRVTEGTLDQKGRLATEQMTGFAPLTNDYDARGRLIARTQGTGANERSFNYQYDSTPSDDGYLDSITDPESTTVSFSLYDPAGRLLAVELPDASQILFDYDSKGNLTSVTPSGRPAHTFDHTQVNLIQEYDPPDVGASQDQTLYTYNLDRQLELVTRPDGKQVDYIYDSASGQIDRIAVLEGAAEVGDIVYMYYPPDHASAYKLASITAVDGGTVQFSYDGTLLTGISWTGSLTGSVGYTYNQNFEVSTETVNGQFPVSFLYDQDGLLKQVGALILNRDIPANPDTQNGLLRDTVLSNATTHLNYNVFGELTDFETSFDDTSGPVMVFESHYTLSDKLGRIKEKTETTLGETKTYAYEYDQLGRLWTVSENTTLVRQYEYDANGNRLLYDGQGALDVEYDNQDRMLRYGDTTYTYSENGELSTKTNESGQTHYAYDVFGNLIEVELPDGTLVEYLVDGVNRRIGKKVNGALVQGFLYGGRLNPLAELDNAGNVVSRFVYGSKIHVPQYMIKEGKTYRIVSDYLGSVRLVFDAEDGTVVQQMEYDEFGIVLLDTNPGFQPFGFAGGLYDLYTGLTRLGARDYDPYTGRWTSKDPLMFNSDGVNLYLYGKGDPINNIDMFGTITTCARCPNFEEEKSPSPKPKGKKKFRKKGKKKRKKKGRRGKRGRKNRRRRPLGCGGRPRLPKLEPIPLPQPVTVTAVDDVTGESFPVELEVDKYGGLPPGTPLHEVDVEIVESSGDDITVRVTRGDVVGYSE